MQANPPHVGIITLPMNGNFGGLLQAVALQHAVQGLGCQATTMYWGAKERYPHDNTYRYWRRRYFDWCFYHIRSKGLACLTKAAKYRYTAFMHRHLKQLVCPFPFSPSFMSKQGFTHWIVGGDQVFRYIYMHRQDCMLLNFLTPEQRRSCFSYSSSFGTDEWEWPEELTEQGRSLIADFKAVSIRETSGVELCRRHLGKEACVMPDPTWLLTNEEYEALMADDTTPLPEQYAAYYILDETPEIKAWIERFCTQHHCAAVDMMIDYHSFVGRGKKKFKVQHSPAFWLKSLRHARYLITDSFHGVLFALMFRIPFVCFGNKTRGNARFDMLVSQFNIGERIITTDAETAITAFTDEENTSFTLKRQKLREEGLEFLANNLGVSKG